MLELNRRVLFAVSLGLHLLVAVFIAAAPAFARQWPAFEQLRFLRQTLGWDGVADQVRIKLAEDHYGSVLVMTRDMAAEMLYYLRDSDVPLYIWTRGSSPHNHYEMTRPFTASAPEPILFVTLRGCPEGITRHFSEVTELAPARVPLVDTRSRTVSFCRLAGYEPEPAP